MFLYDYGAQHRNVLTMNKSFYFLLKDLRFSFPHPYSKKFTQVILNHIQFDHPGAIGLLLLLLDTITWIFLASSPTNQSIFNQSQILHRNKKVDIDFLFTIEKMVCIHQHYEVKLLIYKKKNKVPKGLLLKFHLALCTYNKILREQCNNILFNALLQISNKMIKALGQKINYLKKEKNPY